MPQLTWKNINIPSGGSSRQPIPAAADLFEGAFDAFGKVVSDKQALDARNFETQTKQNTLAIRSNIEQLNSLAALNKEKPNLAIASLKEKYGVQFTPDEVDKLVVDQQNKLRTRAYGVASEVGGQAADQNFDVYAGGKAVEDSLLEQGMDAQVARTKANEWVKNSQMRQGQYAKTRADNTQNFLTQLQNVPEQPTSLEEARELVDTGVVQYTETGGVDRNQALKMMQTAVRNRQTDDERERDKIEYDRKKNIRTEVNRYGTLFREELSRTGSFTNVLKRMSNIQDQEVYSALASQVIPGLKAQANMTKEQEIDHTRLTGNLANQTEQINIANTQKRSQLEKIWIDARGFSKETEAYVTSLAVKGENFVQSLTADATGTGLWTRMLNGRVVHNDAAIKAVNTIYQRAITTGDLDPKTAQALLFKTMADNIDKNQNFLVSGSGVNKTALSKKFTENVQDYKNNQVYQKDLIAFDQDMVADKRNLDYQSSNIILDHIQLSRIENLGNVVDPVVSELKLENSALQKYNTKVATRKIKVDTATKKVEDKPDNSNQETLKKAAEAKKKPDKSILEERIRRETQSAGYRQPEPETIPFTFKKRPQ